MLKDYTTIILITVFYELVQQIQLTLGNTGTPIDDLMMKNIKNNDIDLVSKLKQF